MGNSALRIIRTLALAALAAVVTTSCPKPIDDELLMVVEDRVAPLITITTPADDSTYSFLLSVTGTLHDSSQTAGDGKGFVRTLEFAVPKDPGLNRAITFERDGTWTVDPPDPTFDFDPSTGAFSFTVDTGELRGWCSLEFTVTDLNANETEQEIRVQSAETGPDITFSNCPTIYSSAVTMSITMQGNVAPAYLDFGTTCYSVVPTIGLPRTDVPITYPAEIDSSGNFIFTFNPRVSPTLAGKLTVTVYAKDIKNTPSNEAHDIYDDPGNPTGTFTVASGATYTTNPDTSLTFTITDAISGVKDRRFKNDSDPWNDGDWVDWIGGTLTLPWSLQPTDGTRTVYAQFRDVAGNRLDINDTIVLDTVQPAVSTFWINSDAAWTNSKDVMLAIAVSDPNPASGMEKMRIKNETAPADPDPWVDYAGGSLPWSLQATDGTRTVYAQFRDKAGNITTTSDSIGLDRTNPSIDVFVINNDDYSTPSRSVVLTITASDSPLDPYQMQFSNNGVDWDDPLDYAPTYNGWLLAAGSPGQRTVYVRVIDRAGNTQSASDDINYAP